MKILTAQEMKQIDAMTSSQFLIPPSILMERAGLSVVLALESVIGNLSKKSFLVLCGHGNNGGDGLVVARTLLQYTNNVVTVLVGDKNRMSTETLENFNRLIAVGGILKVLGEDLSFDELTKMIANYDVVIDALLGIGVKGTVQGVYAQVIDAVNILARYVVSVDLPSGVDADTGKVLGTAIRSDLTVTFGLPKLCHVLFPGRDLTGQLKVANIGIPNTLLQSDSIKRQIITRDMVLGKLPNRIKDSHKGTYGRVLAIAGSRFYPGAAILTTVAAYRVGAGYVQLLTCKPADEMALMKEPSLIVSGVEENVLSSSALPMALEIAKKSNVVVVGPGLTYSKQTQDFVTALLRQIDIPVIVDADGLNNLVDRLEILLERKGPTLITPHVGEFARLTKLSPEDIKYDYKTVEQFSRRYNVITLLKGATTIISDGENTYFNLTGNTSLAKAGSGDVLSGMIAGLAAQKLNLLDAAICGSYLHGLAAEMYNLEEGTMLTSELLNLIPKAIEEVHKIG